MYMLYISNTKLFKVIVFVRNIAHVRICEFGSIDYICAFHCETASGR